MIMDRLAKPLTARTPRPLALIALVVGFCFSLSANAIILNPGPGAYAEDEGVISFVPDSQTFFLEAFDALPSLNVVSRFGFYRLSDPATLISIFSAEDQAAPDQIALADFGGGYVADIDEGVAESGFAPGLGPIGFFLELTGILTVYSDPALNGGDDFMAAFQSLTDPTSYFIGAEIPDGAGGNATVYLALASGITAQATTATAVPVGSSLALVLLGLGLASSRRRTK